MATKYKPTNFAYDESRIPQITSGVSSAYDSAKTTYLDMLTSLKPRYEELYKNLETEKNLAMAKDTALANQEIVGQKQALAQRGLEVNESDTYYAGEKSKLQSQQLGRSQETALNYAKQRTEIANAESQDTRDVNAQIANIEISRAKDIQDLISNDKAFQFQQYQSAEANKQWKAQFDESNKQWSKSFKQQVKNDKTAQKNWKATFEYTKSKDAADRALEYYRLAKSGSGGGGSSKYTGDISTAVAQVFSGAYGSGSGIRENVRDALLAKYPSMAKTIESDVKKFFPDGFESRISQVKGGSAPQIQTIMEEYGVDESTATKMFQQANGIY